MSKKPLRPPKFGKGQGKQWKRIMLIKRRQKTAAAQIELDLKIIQGHPKLQEFYVQKLTEISKAGKGRKRMVQIMAMEITRQYAKEQEIPWSP